MGAHTHTHTWEQHRLGVIPGIGSDFSFEPLFVKTSCDSFDSLLKLFCNFLFSTTIVIKRDLRPAGSLLQQLLLSLLSSLQHHRATAADAVRTVWEWLKGRMRTGQPHTATQTLSYL